jgi:arylsulfatase A-like enzyme
VSQRPNILLIMTDQQRADCLGVEGHPVLLTPTLDHLAAEGVRFTNAYSTCPTCIAARRSLLAGQFPATHGMVGYRDGVEWNAPPTLPGVLRSHGYHTCLVGRSMHQYPFRKRYGYDHMVVHGWDSDYEEWLRERQPPGSGGYYGTGVMHNDWTARPWHMAEGLHHTNWTVNEALRFLKGRDPSCPYFLTVSFLAPHPPLVPPACYFERYLRSDLPEPVIGDWAEPPANGGVGAGQSSSRVNLSGEALRSCQAAYFGLINHVDDQINRLLNTVTGVGRDEAVVMFTSDHGEMLGDHHLWRKTVPYEASARIPLLVRGPRDLGIKEGLVCDRLACLEDVMPTLLDLTGIESPATVEGRSLAPLLRGEEAAWRSRLHVEHAPLYHAMTDGREKYVWFVRDGREQFFDLLHDRQERHDLSRDPASADRVSWWRAALIEGLRDRPEGFTDGRQLIPGRPYDAVLPHGGTADADWRRTRR